MEEKGKVYFSLVMTLVSTSEMYQNMESWGLELDFASNVNFSLGNKTNPNLLEYFSTVLALLMLHSKY